MPLKERLSHDLKDAMRAKDRVRLSAIRMLQAAIIEKEKRGSGAVDEEALTALVQKQVKQRRDAIAQFRDAGRDDLADQEAAELAILEAYLPAQASDDEIARIVADVVERAGAASMKDMGRVMGQAMQALRGQADGNRVRLAVERVLKG